MHLGQKGEHFSVWSSSVWAAFAFTKCTHDWGLTQQKCIAQGPGGGQPEDSQQARSGEALSGWQRAGFSSDVQVAESKLSHEARTGTNPIH